MAGVCIYCGFAGTNDELADHAGECPVMCADHQPDDYVSEENNSETYNEGIEDVF